MNTLEDFENAPVGATATHPDGIREVIREGEEADGFPWVCTTYGELFCNEELADVGYTLVPSAPTTAHEALDLAWKLAHPVKEWQVIPKGTRYLEKRNNGLIKECTMDRITAISHGLLNSVRTHEPLSDHEPDWLDATAVLAYGPATNLLQVWVKDNQDTGYYRTITNRSAHYVALNDVTPLYPKGQTR